MKFRDAGFLLAFSTALLPLRSVWLIEPPLWHRVMDARALAQRRET